MGFITRCWKAVSPLTSNWKLIGAGILVLIFFGLFIYAAFESHHAATLRLERDEAKANLVAYETALTQYQASTSARIKALEGESTRATARATDLQKLLGQIQGETNEKDGPVAPVLRDALDGLYGTGPATATDQAGRSAKPTYLPTGAAKSRP